MKFLEMTINALFDDRGRVHLYVYNNRKIERGLSIKNYIYAFDNTDEKILFSNFYFLIFISNFYFLKLKCLGRAPSIY